MSKNVAMNLSVDNSDNYNYPIVSNTEKILVLIKMY